MWLRTGSREEQVTELPEGAQAPVEHLWSTVSEVNPHTQTPTRTHPHTHSPIDRSAPITASPFPPTVPSCYLSRRFPVDSIRFNAALPLPPSSTHPPLAGTPRRRPAPAQSRRSWPDSQTVPIEQEGRSRCYTSGSSGSVNKERGSAVCNRSTPMHGWDRVFWECCSLSSSVTHWCITSLTHRELIGGHGAPGLPSRRASLEWPCLPACCAWSMSMKDESMQGCSIPKGAFCERQEEE